MMTKQTCYACRVEQATTRDETILLCATCHAAFKYLNKLIPDELTVEDCSTHLVAIEDRSAFIYAALGTLDEVNVESVAKLRYHEETARKRWHDCRKRWARLNV